ncbi:glycoside hydrolase family 15 protein [Kribbella sp. NPDC050241]|uniref:glycoside hydrolase family 15 protein n=1 Tax=Kribbella sp. NPDC050241 TaxID=3364115 RepID=UPI0037B354BC
MRFSNVFVCRPRLMEPATALCEKLLSYASPLGLYAEEIDPRSGRHLGNFPQAFTHLAMINAITHIIRARGSGRYEHLRPSTPATLTER